MSGKIEAATCRGKAQGLVIKLRPDGMINHFVHNYMECDTHYYTAAGENLISDL